MDSNQAENLFLCNPCEFLKQPSNYLNPIHLYFGLLLPIMLNILWVSFIYK